MTKQEILDYFSLIDLAYNESGRLESLARMIDELLKEQDAVTIKRQKSLMGMVCMAVSAQSAETGFNQHIHSVDSADRR